MIRRIRANRVHANPWWQVFDDDVTFDDRSTGTYMRLEPTAPGQGVVLLPIALDQVGFVRTYRYPIDQWQWALPRGFASHQDPIDTARAELAEEIGPSEADLTVLGSLTPDSGLLDVTVALVVARLPAPVSAPTDRREVKEVTWWSPAEVWTRIAAGELHDGFTLAAVAMAAARGVLPPP